MTRAGKRLISSAKSARYATFHACPHCERILSIPEMVEKHCERCTSDIQPIEIREKAA